MANWKLKGLRGDQRRRFLKMMGLACAGMGLERTELLNYLADQGGHRLAEASVSKSQRALMVSCGNGVYAWMQELWPHYEIAHRAVGSLATGGTSGGDPGYAGSVAYLYSDAMGWNGDAKFDGSYGEFFTPAGYDFTKPEDYADRPIFYSPHAPWRGNNGQPVRPVSAFMAGNDETHTPFPSSANLVSGSSMSAVIGSIQAESSTAIIPVLGLDPLQFGDADGAPSVSTAPSADGIIGLFNSAASRFVLAQSEDQKMFETYYKALVGLRRAAPRSTWQPNLQVAKGAARLIGLNFADALTATVEDQTLYGLFELDEESASNITSAQKAGLDAFGRVLIVIAKAFKEGLSNGAVVGLSPGPTSDQQWTDPHVTFASTTTRRTGRYTTYYLGKMLDAFYEDLSGTDAIMENGEKIADNTVFVTWGDTPHTPSIASGWPDATPSDCNWSYVMDPRENISQGWFGRVTGDSQNNNTPVYGFNPVTGEDVLNQPATVTASAAGAAAAYAVANGNLNVVSQHFVGAPPEALFKS